MFIRTIKLTRKKLAAAVITAGAVIVAAVLLAGYLSRGGDAFAAPKSNRGVRSNDERLAYITTYGWDVAPEPRETQDVRIPAEFDPVYSRYNDLQREQGMDLTRYRGRRATRYTYEVRNYPTGEKGIRLSLLIYDNDVVIAGDVSSPALDGFMHGLAMP